MFFCPKCRYSTDKTCNFCPNCGERMMTYYAPPVVAPAPAPAESKAKGIVGGALGIAGFAMSMFAAYFAFFSIIMGSADGFVAIFIALYAMIFGVIALPLSIVGNVIARGAYNRGNTMGIVKIGKTLALVGIIAAGASMLVAFLAFLVVMEIY